MRQPRGPETRPWRRLRYSKADGQTIFPKLPVYLRLYHATWQKNKRIIDAISRIKEPLLALRQAMEASATQLSGVRMSSGVDAAHTATAPAASAPASTSPSGTSPLYSQVHIRPDIEQPPICSSNVSSSEAYVTSVAGMLLQPQGDGSAHEGKRKRTAHPCPRCVSFQGQLAWHCKGRGGVAHCQHFTATGGPAPPKKPRKEVPCKRCVLAGSLQQAIECPGRQHHTAKCRYFGADGSPK